MSTSNSIRQAVRYALLTGALATAHDGTAGRRARVQHHQ